MRATTNASPSTSKAAPVGELGRGLDEPVALAGHEDELDLDRCLVGSGMRERRGSLVERCLTLCELFLLRRDCALAGLDGRSLELDGPELLPPPRELVLGAGQLRLSP